LATSIVLSLSISLGNVHFGSKDPNSINRGKIKSRLRRLDHRFGTKEVQDSEFNPIVGDRVTPVMANIERSATNEISLQREITLVPSIERSEHTSKHAPHLAKIVVGIVASPSEKIQSSRRHSKFPLDTDLHRGKAKLLSR
jgi:hypothetical protein